MDHVVPDVLHLILRVVEKQLQATIRVAQDRPQDLERLRTLLGCIIGNPHLMLMKDKQVLRPKLNGGQVDALLGQYESICFGIQGESAKSVEAKKEIWRLLKEIKTDLYKSSLTPAEISSLKTKIGIWGKKFCTRFGTSDFPNSGHVLCMHVPCYLDKYGSLAKFSQQGMEKLVADLKSYTHTCQSPQQNIPKGLLEKENQTLLFLEEDHQKRAVSDVCSYCHVRGHRVTNKQCPYHATYLQEKQRKQTNAVNTGKP